MISDEHVRVMAEQVIAARVAMARQDPNEFAELVLRDERTGVPILQGELHRRWHDDADLHDRLVIWASREAGKTQQLSVARTLHELGRNPKIRIALVSSTAEHGQKIVQLLTQFIEGRAPGSEMLHRIFPHLRPGRPWTNRKLHIAGSGGSKDPNFQVVGVHGAIIGSRIDLLILDDILTYENCRTAARRDDLWGWIQSTLVGCLADGARVLCIGTAFHPEDAMHRFQALPGWVGRQYPIIDPETQEPVWSEVWPIERINQRRTELAPDEFARQMLCQARDDASARFHAEWISTACERGKAMRLYRDLDSIPDGVWEMACELPNGKTAPPRTYTGVDLAVSKKSTADETAISTIMVWGDNTRHLIGLDCGRWSGKEIIARTVDAHYRYDSIVAVENNACFPAGQRVLTREGYRPIECVSPGDYVLTHNKRWMPVVERTSRWYEGDLLQVKPRGGLPITCTPKHALWMRDSKRQRPHGLPGWRSACLAERGQYTCTPIATWPTQDPIVDLHLHGKPFRAKISEKIALMLGLYMAEGSCAAPGQFQFALHEDETYIVDFLRDAADELSASIRVCPQPDDRGVRVTINSTAWRRLVHEMGKSSGKCLPWDWMGWPIAVRTAIIRGWLVGDGCLRVSNKNTHPQSFLSGSTISRDWAMQVHHTLLELGLRPRLQYVKPKKSEIDGRVFYGEEAYLISLCSDDIPLGRTSPSTIVVDEDSNGSAWSRLHEVRQLETRFCGLVYNLVVEEDHSYVVEDIAVHNSQDFIRQFIADEGIPVVAHTTTSKRKHSPEFGIEAVAAEMAASKWIFPSRDGTDRGMETEVHKLAQEMLYYSPDAHTGDRLAATWFARQLAHAEERRSRRSHGVSVRIVG